MFGTSCILYRPPRRVGVLLVTLVPCDCCDSRKEDAVADERSTSQGNENLIPRCGERVDQPQDPDNTKKAASGCHC